VIRLLFVDDDPRAHDTLELVLPQEYELQSATTLAEGERVVAGGDVDIVLLDLVLPDGSGMELLRRIKATPLGPPVVILTGHADVRLAVDATRAGASDYLVKPYELRTLLATLHTALVNSTARRNGGGRTPPADGLVGESPALLQVRELMEVYADSDAPVMVTGESGTGKELVARGIHRLSHRAAAPFVAVNCGAIPDTLVESELFGSEEGAFTGAVSRPGCFERADGGTLFLDEVADMPLDTQVKLLRALENREVTRVGGRYPLEVNVRVVSATNRDIEAQVADGAMRADLWYRLAVLLIHVPPLRERREDIPLLAHALLRETTSRAGRIVAAVGVTLSDAALQRLATHTWPGNVRELRNVLERARLLARRRSGAQAPLLIDARDIVLDTALPRR
jgi:two-component system response regulator PilR (NtrC family)